MTKAKILQELCAIDLSRISFPKLMDILLNQISSFPLLEIDIKKGSVIERGRINEAESLYMSEREITIRDDFQNIKHFGRAHIPFRPVFYGSMISDDLEYPRYTILTELSERFRKGEDFEIAFTVGRWRVKRDFVACSFLYSDQYQEIERINKLIREWNKKLDENKDLDRDELKRIGMLISDEFAKSEIRSNDDYKISAAMSEIIYKAGKADAILYPGVRSDYKGLNIAIKGGSVIDLLELEKVALFKANIINKKGDLNMTAIAEGLGPFNTEFKWIPVNN